VANIVIAPYIYILSEGLIFGSFHALASVSFVRFSLPLKYILQGILDIYFITVDI
jgi:hypothetical protein